MNTTTHTDKGKAFKQWCWFVGLWCAGFLAAVMITLPLKMLIKYGF